MAETLTQTTGRRKTAVARVRFYGGSGNVSINGKVLTTTSHLPIIALESWNL